MPLLQGLQETITIRALRGPSSVEAEGSVIYEGDVKVSYRSLRFGIVTVTADRMVVYDKQQRGVAEGHVTLIDPDGTMQADRIEFSWDPNHRVGNAENVVVRLVGATLKARRATFQPGEWTLIDVEGTTCLRPDPVYYVTSEKIIIRPGQNLVVREPRVSLLGSFIAELPSQNISLSRAVPGIHLPTPGYRIGQGLGATWSGAVVAGEDATFSFSARSFQQRKPNALALYTRSLIPLSESTEVVAPRTDFGERFGFGYLDSVKVDTPEVENRYLRAERSSVSFGGQLNGSVSDRERGVRYSKIEAVAERGTGSKGFGFLGQARVQEIRREQEDFVTRAVVAGSIGVPTLSLAPGLSTIARLDSQAFLGATGFGWGRAMAGLSYKPTSWLRLSGAGFVSGEVGTPQFGMDPLFSKNGFLMRADLNMGGLRVSYIEKVDGRLGFYDRELAINQVIGCFEAFYVRRQYPNDRRFGLTIRVQPLIDLFKRRGLDQSQSAASQSIITP